MKISLNKNSKIYVAGHTGLVGSSLVKTLKYYGFENLIFSLAFRDTDFRRTSGSEAGLYCSQLVWQAGMAAGVDLDSGLFSFNSIVTPFEIYYSDNVVKIDESAARQNQRRTVIRIESPADLLLIDPQGRSTGTDPYTGATRAEIPDVFYFGPDEEIGPEYLTVKDLDGPWTLLVGGIGNGLFTIVMENAEKDNYSTATTTGIASPGSLAMYRVRNSSEGVAFTRVVDIDIKPGSYSNCLNNRSNVIIPVAILGSPLVHARCPRRCS